jgi:hypothetical protein
MYAGPLRFLRALTVSATCVALSLATHLVGAGAGMHHVPVVSVLGLLMITVLVTLVLAGLSGRRWTLARTLIALALGQAVLHTTFTVLLPLPPAPSPGGPLGESSMVLAHAVVAMLIGVGIAVSDSALDTYFCVALSRVGSGSSVLSPWRLAELIPGVDAVAARDPGRGERFARWRRPRILTDLVVLQCRSGRGPPAPAC